MQVEFRRAYVTAELEAKLSDFDTFQNTEDWARRRSLQAAESLTRLREQCSELHSSDSLARCGKSGRTIPEGAGGSLRKADPFMGNRAIEPYYERRALSAQNVADLFAGTWKSALPGVASGDAPMFDDSRPAWVASQLPGGFYGKSVLELGPFEGYQTYRMLAQGRAESSRSRRTRSTF